MRKAHKYKDSDDDDDDDDESVKLVMCRHWSENGEKEKDRTKQSKNCH